MKIALLGMGTIGSGVFDMLKGHDGITVKRILDRRTLPPAAEALRTERIEDICGDGEIDTVVELLGGVQPAHAYALGALRAGKNLVSANKLMLSSDFGALLSAARESGVQLRLSASVGGGIPWLPNLLRARRLEAITELGGIVNGTTNFILDAMQRQDMDYAEALDLARRAGYAEADPSADIDGLDAQCKLVLSASIAFDALVAPASIPAAGIGNIGRRDVENFRALGRICRLLARAGRTEAGLTAYVEPTLIGPDAREASVLRNDNCIGFSGENSGALAFIGQGAGRQPTAFAVVGDLADILAGAPGPEYVPSLRRAAADNALAAHRYYVRTAAPLPFAAEPVAEGAFLTEEISVRDMHARMQALLRDDPGAFFAGLGGE